MKRGDIFTYVGNPAYPKRHRQLADAGIVCIANEDADGRIYLIELYGMKPAVRWMFGEHVADELRLIVVHVNDCRVLGNVEQGDDT